MSIFSQQCVSVLTEGSFFDVQAGSAEIRPVWSHAQPCAIAAAIREATELEIILSVAILVRLTHNVFFHSANIAASLGRLMFGWNVLKLISFLGQFLC